MRNEIWFIRTIKRLSNKYALGYESNLDFCFGIISGWLAAGLINKKFYNELLDNFANYNFDNDYEKISFKYKRILA